MIGIARLTRHPFGAALLVLGIDFAAAPVQAQLASSQPIKIVVGVPAGGLGDEQALGRGDPHKRHQTRGQLSDKLAIAINACPATQRSRNQKF
jgi:hypothetical protein